MEKVLERGCDMVNQPGFDIQYGRGHVGGSVISTRCPTVKGPCRVVREALWGRVGAKEVDGMLPQGDCYIAIVPRDWGCL